MDRLFTSANLYYAVLERFGIVFWVRSLWTWLLIFSSLALVYGGWLYIVEFRSTRAPFDWPVIYVMLPETLLLLSLSRLRQKKETAALERINAKYNKNFSSLRQGRRYLLSHFFGRKESDYLSFVDEIGKVISYRDQFRVPIPTGFGDGVRLIYDPDSKQRIYALLIVIASALTALAVREGSGISNVFALIDAGAGSLFVAWTVMVIFLGLSLAVLLAFRVGLVALISYLTVLFDGESARDPLTLRYLQRDLLNFHRFVHLRATTHNH